jgi:hypothetical protein
MVQATITDGIRGTRKATIAPLRKFIAYVCVCVCVCVWTTDVVPELSNGEHSPPIRKGGVSQTNAIETNHLAGVSIPAWCGICGFCGSMSLNYQLMATTTSSFNEYRESSREWGLTVESFQACVYFVGHV